MAVAVADILAAYSAWEEDLEVEAVVQEAGLGLGMVAAYLANCEDLRIRRGTEEVELGDRRVTVVLGGAIGCIDGLAVVVVVDGVGSRWGSCLSLLVWGVEGFGRKLLERVVLRMRSLRRRVEVVVLDVVACRLVLGRDS